MVLHEEELKKTLNRMGNSIFQLIALTRNLGMDYGDLLCALGSKEIALKESAGIRDRVILEHRDKDGNLLGMRDSGWVQHTMTNAGYAGVAGLILTDVGGTAWDYVAIGTGTASASTADIALGTETHREAGTGTRYTTAVADDTARLQRTFSGYSGTEAVTETGVFNAGVSGTLLCRQVFDVLNINWTGGDSLASDWRVQCKAG